MNSVMLEGGDQVNRCMTVLKWYGEDEMRGGGFGCLFRYQDLGKEVLFIQEKQNE